LNLHNYIDCKNVCVVKPPELLKPLKRFKYLQQFDLEITDQGSTVDFGSNGYECSAQAIRPWITKAPTEQIAAQLTRACEVLRVRSSNN